VLFARHPAARVKTRLVPPLTPAEARRLHAACLESSLRLAASLPRRVHRWLYLTPAPRGTRFRLPRGSRVRAQRGRDLGARLRGALRELTRQGYARVVFIGSDSPTLPRAYLQRAFASLARADAVLGPARDGGYTLIGLRAVPGAEEVFRGIAWGTARAFRQTLARLRRAKRRTVILPVWYDVDVPADLRRLRRELARSRSPHLAPLRTWLETQR
jgi:hypothetical protein